MNKIIIALLISLFAVTASALTLSELVKAVKKSATESSAENRQRVSEFKGKRDQQQKLLSNARATLRSLEAQTDALKAEFDENENHWLN